MPVWISSSRFFLTFVLLYIQARDVHSQVALTVVRSFDSQPISILVCLIVRFKEKKKPLKLKILEVYYNLHARSGKQLEINIYK